MTCPLCRQEADVPDGDAAKFPTNFLLKELIEEEAKKEQLTAAGSAFTCTCCEARSTVAAKCDDCNQYLCTDGMGAHKRFAALRNHKILTLEAPTQVNKKQKKLY